MKVKFDKSCKGVCRYLTIGKGYEVIEEDDMNYKVKDDSGMVVAYPKVWVKEVEEDNSEG